MEKYGVSRWAKRAEIDTSSPFRSVKEAVMLFGEKVLVGEVYAHKLKEMKKEDESYKNANTRSKFDTITAELEVTKEDLEKAREQSMILESSLTSMQQELENTKRELNQLKTRECEKKVIEEEIVEDLKFVEDSIDIEKETLNNNVETQKKRYVTFASPPTLTHVIVTQDDATLGSHPSLKKKKKKKPLIPLIGGIFTKKK